MKNKVDLLELKIEVLEKKLEIIDTYGDKLFEYIDLESIKSNETAYGYMSDLARLIERLDNSIEEINKLILIQNEIEKLKK